MSKVNPVKVKKVWKKPALIKLSEEEALKKGVKLTINEKS